MSAASDGLTGEQGPDDLDDACAVEPGRLTAAQVAGAYYQGEAYMPEITRALAGLSDGQRWAVLGMIEAFQPPN